MPRPQKIPSSCRTGILNDKTERDPRLFAIPDTHGHAKGEHKPYIEERPLPLTARMLFLWFYHACRRGYPRFLMVADHMNYLTFEDPAAVNLVRRALKLAQAGDLYGAAETANVDVAHAAVVSEGLRRGMRYSIGAEVDNDPRSRPDAQNIVDAMRPDGIIRSVHFIPIAHPVHGENWLWPFDNPEFKELYEHVGAERLWETYVATLVDAIERLPGHIVGHFFVPALFGHWPDDAKLSEYEDRVLAAADARGMAIEFNTRFFYRDYTDDEKDRYLAANKRFLRKAKDRGVQIAIGSDAHSPRDQGGAFEVVLSVLDELDINEIVFPMGGQLRRVALRVVREPEPPAPPAPEPRAPEVLAEAKPVRKARPKASASRAPETSPERPPSRPETPSAGTGSAAPNPESPPSTASAPKRSKPAPRKAPEATKPASEPKAPAAPASAAKSAETKGTGAVKAPAKVAATPKLAKAPAKASPAKARADAKPARKPAVKAASRRAPAAKTAARPPAKPSKARAKPSKPSAKTSKAAGKKASAARPAAKKTARAKHAGSAKRSAPKKAAAARAPAKKAAPRKPAAKKPAVRAVPVRKAGAAKKKTTAKKTAAKRR